ncbi:DUF4124 domain-containing protein [uncultured Thiodictyon sp.]|uniref:DUF4124 domain-containing protein n=1 Tax=uncultured Thiodictyon sp. TaxID=1846217 RepID=UPI0025E6C5CB|nr:DUF4124 domain-containing protein [uncultured Thiodictyon sp.]
MIARSQPTDTAGRPRPNRRARTLAYTLAACTCLAAPPYLAGAQLYRWVDETGTTVYSQRPPPGTTAKTIKLDRAPPTVEPATDQAAAAADRQEQQTRTAEQTRQANCAAARKNLETLDKHGNEPIRTADGKIGVLAPDELAKLKAQAQQQIEANCK